MVSKSLTKLRPRAHVLAWESSLQVPPTGMVEIDLNDTDLVDLIVQEDEERPQIPMVGLVCNIEMTNWLRQVTVIAKTTSIRSWPSSHPFVAL